MATNSKLDVEKGGANNKAPYKVTHVRCPEPIKDDIVQRIKEFKLRVELGDIILNGHQVYRQISLSKDVAWDDVLLAVNQFIAEKDLADSMATRNNVNLKRFRDWVISRAAAL